MPTYQCKRCDFVGTTLAEMGKHYREVHGGTVDPIGPKVNEEYTEEQPVEIMIPWRLLDERFKVMSTGAPIRGYFIGYITPTGVRVSKFFVSKQ